MKHAICVTADASVENAPHKHEPMASSNVLLADNAFAEHIRPKEGKDDNNLVQQDQFTQAIILLPIVVIGTIWAVGRPIKGREVGWSLR